MFDLTDIGCYTILSIVCRAKFQQAGNLTMGAANVKRQLAINEYPNVIVTGEEELDVGFYIFPSTVLFVSTLPSSVRVKSICSLVPKP